MKNFIKSITKSSNFKIAVFAVFIFVLGYLSLRDSFVKSINEGYLSNNSVISSVVVAIDTFINPNGVIASVQEVIDTKDGINGTLVEDVFRRCTIQSENRSTKANFKIYDTKTGINNGFYIFGDDENERIVQEVRDYLRWNNRSSLDLEVSQIVLILGEKGTPQQLANAIRLNNEQGFIPIVRLGIADLGVFPFKLTENADEMVEYFAEVGKILMNEKRGYRAVISLGPNEPNTGDIGAILSSTGVDSYQTLVRRQNQAADRLQQYRVKNGGVFWLGSAIFNGVPGPTINYNGKEYAYDVYNHLYIGDGPNDTSTNYWERQSLDTNLFDAILHNVYSQASKTAYEYYEEFGPKDFVDSRPNLVTIITEFGAINGGISTEDIKDDFAKLYDDPKIQGINYFRAIRDKDELFADPKPSNDQQITIEDFIKFTEQSKSAAGLISLKNSSWLNCNVASNLYDIATASGQNNPGVLNPTNKGGLNEGDNVGGGQGTMDKAKSVGLQGYSLAIAYKPGDAVAAIQFINDSVSRGFVPIIRLCVDEGTPCEFNLSGGNSADLVSFYNQVAEGANSTFIGIMGPNEPKTEVDVFKASIEDAVTAAIDASGKVNKRGRMLAAPAAFNLQTDELDIYRRAFEVGKFEVLIGNAYNIGGESVEQISNNAIDYAKSKGLKFILTETGVIGGSTAEDFKTVIGRLCSRIDGFLLFRSLSGSPDGNYTNKPTPFSDDELRAIATSCANTNPIVDTGDAVVSDNTNVLGLTNVVDKRSNFAGSFAISCGSEDEQPASSYQGKSGPGLLVKCDGGSCTTKKTDTVDIEAPIRSFVSNSPTGTIRNAYIPVSQVASSLSNTSSLDALNLFAGEIKVNGKSYPMPGLGSGINSAYQILAQTATQRDPNRTILNSKGATTKVTLNRMSSQLEKDTALTILGNVGIPGSTSRLASVAEDEGELKTIDDRGICFNGNCFNVDTGLAWGMKNMYPFDPAVAFPSFLAPKACSSTKMKFVNTLDDYVTGPEMILNKETTVSTNTPQEICLQYAGRSLTGSLTSGDGVKTCGYIFDTRMFQGADINALSPRDGKPLRRISEQVFDPLTGRIIVNSRIERGQWTCRELFDGKANPADGIVEDAEFANTPVPGGSQLPNCDFDDYYLETSNPKGQLPDGVIRSGSCEIPDDLKSCLRYDPQSTDQIYIHTSSFADLKNISIPGMYSAIYGLYDRLQTMASNRDMKFVFPENIGIKVKFNSKIRDENQSIAESNYRFADYTDEFSVLPELIDNKAPLANGNSVKTKYQYYDDLGYLNILQELIVAYVNEQTLVGDHIIDNPFEGTPVNPLPGRSKIVAGGISNLALSRPILTCDQVEICKKFSNAELVSQFGEDKAFALCPLSERIPEDAELNCVTNRNDDRLEDKLKDKLCSRGFNVRDGCEFFCRVNDGGEDGEDGGNDGGGGPPINGIYSGTACPAADPLHRCFQGPHGPYSHQDSIGLPLDLYPNFTNGSNFAGNRNKNIVAPEDGEIIAVSNVDGQGARITLLGKTGIRYSILHLNGNDPAMVRSGSVKGGQRIAEIASQATVPGLAYNDTNIHTHIRAEYNGRDIDPYYIFTEILKCNAKRPNPEWPARFKLTAENSGNPKAYCVITEGGFFLNDNGASLRSGTKPGAPDNDLVPIDNNIVKELFDAAYGAPQQLQNSNNSGGNGNFTPTESNAGNIILASQPKARVLGDNTTKFSLRVPTDETSSILSNYGPRCFDRNGERYCDFHTGADIPVPSGSKVVAAESGRVIKVGSEKNGYGNYVRILHPNGQSTLYAHNSQVTVNVGDCVAIGQQIALAGSTGNSTGPHIHLELRKDASCAIAIGDDGKALPSQTCAVNPAPFIESGKTTSSFSDDDLKKVCSGKLPGGGSGGTNPVLQCTPSSDNPVVEPGKVYETVFHLLERVQEVTNVDKYFLTGILSLESGPELQRSIGDYIKDGNALYKGDPLDIGNPDPNSAGAVGPFQFICRTGVSYFYPKGYSPLPCSPWSVGAEGRYYDDVLACVKGLGMQYNQGDVLDPKYFGVGACGAAVKFSNLSGKSISAYDVNQSSAFSSANEFWASAGSYHGGGNYENIPLSKWYADSTIGRAKFFEKYWEEYKSGDKGSDCKPNAFRDWYFYHVDLGIQCISRGPDGQCRITTKEALDRECGR